jgi:hypothetical protein
VLPVAKSRCGTKEPSESRGPLNYKFYPIDKNNAIAGYLENSWRRGNKLESELCWLLQNVVFLANHSAASLLWVTV